MLLLDGISSWLKCKLILFHEAHEWPEVCHKGSRQSPIGVCKKNATRCVIPPLEFYFYNFKYKASLVNDGHSVVIQIIDQETLCQLPTVTGGNLEGEYILDNIHFHWDSEHTVNGKRYPLESHFVHYNKKCGTIKDALKHPDGLLVLGILFEIGPCCNSKLDNIVTTTEKVCNEVGTAKEITGGVVFDQLLPKNRSKYYTYEGSKTTPDCNENVKWIIFEAVLHIGSDQLKRLSDVQSKDGAPIKKNARALQDPGEREVLYISDMTNSKSVIDYIKEKLSI